MDITIKQAILHALDSTADEPILSDACLELDADAAAYLCASIDKTFSGDERKACSFGESSPFLAYPLQDLDGFVPLSQEIALRLFQLMRIYPDIPPADVLMAQAELEGAPHFLLLKLNYQDGFGHTLRAEEGRRLLLTRQRALLPAPGAKGGEAFLLNLTDGGLQVVEKKYPVDGKKDWYFSTRFLECVPALTEKQKFREIQKAAQAIAEQYGADPKEQTRAAAVLCERMAEARPAKVEAICEELYAERPAAKEEFSRLLRENHVELDDVVQVSPAAVRRLEKQSLRSEDGVEIKIPLSLYESDEAVEFIHNEDGTVSLLVKHLVV